ncbi:MAG TPA: GNAT family N-acetyltransferase [Polyangiaceae bacterium]|nr:GNAT family N-acetyltransferase [Polyangiaceae bacterium]
MRDPNAIRAERAGPQHIQSLSALFERSGCSCYCRYWHFDGDKNAWLDRSAHRREDSQREMADALAGASEEMRGVVACVDSGVVGWMKLCAAATLSKLYEQRIYRKLPCFDGDRSGVLSVGCFLVDPEFRRRKVAEALLERGVELARADGSRAIEAFPRRAEGVSDGELWMGPLELFLRTGFKEVHDFRPYPVLRLELGVSA